jgi:hypothetical protein
MGGGFQLSVAIGSGSVDGVVKDSMGRIIGNTMPPR